MRFIDRERIYSDQNLIKYLRENSSWQKRLSRRVDITNMETEMKERYGLRFKDKVEKVGTGLDLINAFMNVTKE